jgi:hypothetical protein
MEELDGRQVRPSRKGTAGPDRLRAQIRYVVAINRPLEMKEKTFGSDFLAAMSIWTGTEATRRCRTSSMPSRSAAS